jgi:hypothetical protein
MPTPTGYSATIPTAASTASLLGAPYPFGPPVYVPPPLIGASSSSSMPDTVRASVPYFSFAPGSGIVRSFTDGGQPLLDQSSMSPTHNNNNNNNDNMNGESKRMDEKQQQPGDAQATGWTGHTFDPRRYFSHFSFHASSMMESMVVCTTVPCPTIGQHY